MVRNGEGLACASDELITELKAGEDRRTGLLDVCAPQLLRPGQLVTVIDGPLEGLQAIFQSPWGHDRVVLLLKMLGTDASVVMPAAFVTAAG